MEGGSGAGNETSATRDYNRPLIRHFWGGVIRRPSVRTPRSFVSSGLISLHVIEFKEIYKYTCICNYIDKCLYSYVLTYNSLCI